MAMRRVKMLCKYCSEKFMPRFRHQKYCCKRCQKSAYQAMETLKAKNSRVITVKQCLWCGRDFKAAATGRNPSQKFCCGQCRENSGHSIRKQLRRNKNELCVQCLKPLDGLFKRQWFCSTACRNIVRHKKRLKGSVEKNCRECNKLFTAYRPWQIACSEACRNQAYNERRKPKQRAYYAKVRDDPNRKARLKAMRTKNLIKRNALINAAKQLLQQTGG